MAEESSNTGQLALIALVALGVGGYIWRGKAKKRRERRIHALGVQEGVDVAASRALREAERLIEDYRAELTRERYNERRLTQLDVKISTLLNKAESADDLWSPEMRQRALLTGKVWEALKHEALAMKGAHMAEKGSGGKGARAEAIFLERVPGAGDLVLVSEVMQASGASYKETLKRAYKLAAADPELEVQKVEGVWVLKRKRG
jgi:hypothetical protein